MTQVRKENSDSLEYVCPECGDTFEEGAEECASCGLEFDWDEELEYLCPECGTIVDPENARCPGCGAKFSMEHDGEITIEYEPDEPPATVEDMVESAIVESIIQPNGTLLPVEPEDYKASDEEEAEAPEEEPAVAPAEAEPIPVDTDEVETLVDVGDYPRLYPGGFTLAGVVFAVLALLALGAAIVMARYDTWIQGAAEESMGDNQRMMFYAALMAFAAFIIIAVYDLLRIPKRKVID